MKKLRMRFSPCRIALRPIAHSAWTVSASFDLVICYAIHWLINNLNAVCQEVPRRNQLQAVQGQLSHGHTEDALLRPGNWARGGSRQERGVWRDQALQVGKRSLKICRICLYLKGKDKKNKMKISVKYIKRTKIKTKYYGFQLNWNLTETFNISVVSCVEFVI